MVAKAKVIIAFFMHLQIVRIRETRKVIKVTIGRKMSFLLMKCRSI